MLVFALTLQRLHVFLRDQIAHSTWSWAESWSVQLERNTDQRLEGATELGPGRLRPAFVTELGPTELGPVLCFKG